MTHYDVLGVARTAPDGEVRRAYVARAREHHPDRSGGDADAMRAVNDAWATLRDPERRAAYDRTLSAAPVIPASPAAEPRVRSDEEELRADLEDDTPIGGQVVLPKWLSLVPVGAFVASLGMVGLGLLFGSTAALSLAFALFAVSCAMFLMAPFVALLASRRGR
jgi:curved DNA-binding protein CbpA